jgi:hypothetical protein
LLKRREKNPFELKKEKKMRKKKEKKSKFNKILKKIHLKYKKN